MNFKIEDAPSKFISLSQITNHYRGQISKPSTIHEIKLDIYSCLHRYIKNYVVTYDDINILVYGGEREHLTVYFSHWLTKVICDEYPELLY